MVGYFTAQAYDSLHRYNDRGAALRYLHKAYMAQKKKLEDERTNAPPTMQGYVPLLLNNTRDTQKTLKEEQPS